MTSSTHTRLSASGLSSTQVFNLELDFTEMHIIMKAMSEYQRVGFNPTGTEPQNFNEHHANAAEKLSDELTDLFCTER